MISSTPTTSADTDPILPLPIIYQDEYLVAINKPSGLLVHRSPIDRHETRFALQLLRDQLGQRVYPAHRLDKPTSGILLFALSSNVAKQLSDSFANHQVKKNYLAVLRGYCDEQGVIDYPLKHHFDKMTDKRARLNKPAQSAITAYQQLATVELPVAVDRYPQSRYSLVAAQPQTGRTHQLRRHFKHISHPIIGDAKYGKSTHNRFFAKEFGATRLLLHAHTINLNHPITGEQLLLTAELEGRFKKVLEHLGWNLD